MPGHICEICGNRFDGYGNRPMRFCSTKCSGIARRGKSLISSTCLFCGSEVLAYRTRKFCGKPCESGYKRSLIPVDKDWLEDKYIGENLTCNDISKIVNRDPKTVWKWIKDHGIQTRGRGAYALNNPIFTFWKTPGGKHPMKGKKFSKEFCQKQREIALADGRIPYDPKIGPPFKGKRGPEVPSWRGGVTPERQAFYSSPEWKNAAKLVWIRDDATCQRCKRRNSGKERFEFDIHHIVSFECKELRADSNNLILLCEDCHYWVHSKENTERVFIREIP